MGGNLHNKQYNYKEREANETEKGAVLIIIIFQGAQINSFKICRSELS